MKRKGIHSTNGSRQPFANADGHGNEESRRVLVVADEAFHGDDLIEEVRSRGFSGSVRTLSVLVVAPALPRSAFGQVASDIDGARVDAYSRLDQVLSELHSIGVPAAGMIGDSDPVVAAGDGLRMFEADDLVVVGHAEQDASWAEHDLWERLESDLDEEVSALLVERPDEVDSGADLVETRRSQGAGHGEGLDPPGRRDLASLFFALLGTIVLGFLSVGAAVGGGIEIQGDLSRPVEAILLIALAAFLVNLATTVTLTLFLSLDYRGFWERFIARSTVAFTSLCLLASVLIWLFLI